jgi:NAD(P)-dependent dehydrogenase (short-subunit alcohol dehydrogenase family)
VVVAEGAAAAARALAREGATVVLVGADAGPLGKLAADIEHAGGRAAVFVGDPASDGAPGALAEMVDELFPPPLG